MTAPRLGLAIIGAGRMGSTHARLIARGAPEIEIKAIGDVNHDAAERLAHELGGVPAFGDPEAAISARGIDAVLVAASSGHHRGIVEAAVAAHRDILCEKPLALTLADTDAMIDAAAAAGVRLQVGLMRRHDPEHQRARERIVAAELGTPTLFTSRQYDSDPVPRGFLEPAVSGGILVDMGIHEFDSARFLLGDEVTEVEAMGALVDPGLAGLDDVDVAVVGLRFASGALGSVELSRRVAYGEDVRTEVHGPNGSVFIGGMPVHGSGVGRDGGISWSGLPASSPRFAAAYTAQARAFAAVIRADREATPSGADARAAFVVALAADRARRSGRVVLVDNVAASAE